MNTFLSPLSLERETECLKKVAQNDKEAKDELILHNMRLVACLLYTSGGDFILRIEDTDQVRQVEGAVNIINRTLEETGLCLLYTSRCV